jgi:mannose-1-phosphate guanylyltransferase
VVNVHHRPDDVRAWAEPEEIAVSHERELLGTAGGMTRANVLLGSGDVLVWNGDILSELDPRDIVAAHAAADAAAHSAESAKPPADAAVRATLAVHARAAGEGNVGFGADGRIVRLRAESVVAGRNATAETRGGDFLGIHVIGEELRALLPERGCLVGDVYLPALRRGERLQAFVTQAPFIDVGSIDQYLAANAQWLRSRGLTSWAHPTATVNAAIDGTVVGAGAVVDAPAVASVVWPGARVHSACNNTVFTQLGVASAR